MFVGKQLIVKVAPRTTSRTKSNIAITNALSNIATTNASKHQSKDQCTKQHSNHKRAPFRTQIPLCHSTILSTHTKRGRWQVQIRRHQETPKQQKNRYSPKRKKKGLEKEPIRKLLIRIEEEAPTPKASFLHQNSVLGFRCQVFFLREVRV